MNTTTMEGLVGARTNMDLVNTPMRFFREARRKGDTETMKRAMGYADEFSAKAEEYQAVADKGMEEDAKEAREKAKLQREEAIRKRREEREKLEKLEEKTAENRKTDADTAAKETGACVLEVSEEGKVLLKDNANLDSAGSGEIKTDAPKEPVTYTKTGETVPAIQEASISVSV